MGAEASVARAIDDANSDPGPDVIELSPKCDYAISAPSADVTRYWWCGPYGLPAIA
jgi:hypothetical protein